MLITFPSCGYEFNVNLNPFPPYTRMIVLLLLLLLLLSPCLGCRTPRNCFFMYGCNRICVCVCFFMVGPLMGAAKIVVSSGQPILYCMYSEKFYLGENALITSYVV